VNGEASADNPGVESSQVYPVVLRSRSQLWAGTAFGVAVVIFGLIGAAQAGYIVGEIAEAAVAIACGALIIGSFARAALVVDESGITIRNPFGHATSIPWREIAAFRIGRYKLLRAVCLVELVDGSLRHASALQIPNYYARRPTNTREAKTITFLNDELTRRSKARFPSRSTWHAQHV
jgi:hypothetical protein